MSIHRDVSDIIHNEVLRDVLQVHGMGIPYPAELWIDGIRQHDDGTVMFKINDRGFLAAEYFGYDGFGPLQTLSIGLQQPTATLTIKGTQVEIPIRRIHSSSKARAWHNVPMPTITAYECELHGPLGDPDSEMNSVSITATGLPDLHLVRMTSPIPPERTGDESLTLRGFKTQWGELSMVVGEWEVDLMASHGDENTDDRHLYHIALSRKDGSPFRLEGGVNDGIIDALRLFLSFQCERWIDMPTVVCNPVFSNIEKSLVLRSGETSELALSAIQKFSRSQRKNAEVMDELFRALQKTPGFEDVADAYISEVAVTDKQATIVFSKGEPTKRLAWVSRLSSQSLPNNTWTAAEVVKWPNLFDGFWRQYTDQNNTIHLKNTISHYVETSRIFYDGAIPYSLVTAQSTLEAIVRWWLGLAKNFHFSHKDGERFKDLLLEAVNKAELGKDQGRSVDEKDITEFVDCATVYRNKIDHGHAINLEKDMQKLANLQMFCHNLARLLLLSRFGVRDTDQRGYLVGPKFKESAC